MRPPTIFERLAGLLAGRKTYLVAAGVVAAALSYTFGSIDEQTLTAGLVVLAGTGAATFRAAIQETQGATYEVADMLHQVCNNAAAADLDALRDKVRGGPTVEHEYCPLAAPHTFCETCKGSPCPIGLDRNNNRHGS